MCIQFTVIQKTILSVKPLSKEQSSILYIGIVQQENVIDIDNYVWLGHNRTN